MTSERSKRRDVYKRHFTVANGIAVREWATVAESGVID